jgi:hypothetical protein
MERNEPEKDARQIAGEPVAELRAIAPSIHVRVAEHSGRITLISPNDHWCGGT